MTTVELKIIDHPSPESIQSKLTFFALKDQDIVMRSALGGDVPLNDHLVWMWGHLQGQRRLLNRVIADGGKLVCTCSVPKGDIRLLSNAAEMLHLLGIDLCIHTK